ncbi:hypothetical protein N7466_009917 [Penicillium verhagenii]|uniref:uncharacterized protein n=1 Tax=Penicillium verhagenii TaxID=1562060 RepID=UPI0025452FB6|nr:uncharacterized protein N7466_009917 [Penicillium verhagenii]KAJ5918974.1 hypothetical protein N7466_009917 [Penicillium verhagenii]
MAATSTLAPPAVLGGLWWLTLDLTPMNWTPGSSLISRFVVTKSGELGRDIYKSLLEAHGKEGKDEEDIAAMLDCPEIRARLKAVYDSAGY